MVQEGCIKVGAVSFLNTKPLIQPILDNQVFNIDLTLDVPSKIADDFRIGTLDVALIPIIEYFRCSDYLILPEISISSRGAVKSIRIFSRKPISECQTIALDTSSRTSRVLTQIVLAEKYNVYPSFVDCPPTVNLESAETDAVLLIGDSALRNIGSAEFEVDLGAVWHDLFELLSFLLFLVFQLLSYIQCFISVQNSLNMYYFLLHFGCCCSLLVLIYLVA